jgi:hypothetical protein
VVAYLAELELTSVPKYPLHHAEIPNEFQCLLPETSKWEQNPILHCVILAVYVKL